MALEQDAGVPVPVLEDEKTVDEEEVEKEEVGEVVDDDGHVAKGTDAELNHGAVPVLSTFPLAAERR